MKCANYFWLRSAGFPNNSIIQSTNLSVNMPEFLELIKLKLRRLQLHEIFKKHIVAIGEEHCRKFERKLNNNQLINISDLPLSLRETIAHYIDEWQNLITNIKTLEIALRPTFYNLSEQNRQQLIDFLGKPEVSEAIFISNPEAAQRINSLVIDRNAPLDSRKKQKLRLGWSYAQRFCTKNDTCSFFGPIAWGHFSNEQDSLASINLKTGHWLAQKETFFENWVLQRINKQINIQCPEPEKLPLSIMPSCHLYDDILYFPLNKSQKVNGILLSILKTLNTQTISEIQLNETLGIDSGSIVHQLINNKIIRRGFQISPRSSSPFLNIEQMMRDAFLPSNFIDKWTLCFQQLEEQRQIYALGDLGQRKKALEEINQILNDADISLSRESGKMYVGRYPIYEDCSRATTVTFNSFFKQKLEENFSPLMSLYQWLTRATAFLLHQAWLDIFQRCQKQYSESISLLTFLHNLQPQQQNIQQQVSKKIRDIFKNAWDPLLKSLIDEELCLTPHHLTQILARLNDQLPEAQKFQVFGDSFHSPDFMLAASSLEELNQGKYLIVLGETHPGVHTLSQPVAKPFCPYTSEIDQLVSDLFDHERIILADSPETYQRSHIDWPLIPQYSQLVLPSGGGCVSPEQRYSSGRAVIHLNAGRLSVEDREGKFKEDLLCVSSSALHQLLFHLAGDILPLYDPRRIRIDNTIYKRRTWEFQTSTWPNIDSDEFIAFIQWKSWQQLQNLPRWVFIKCDSEPKPFFIDFDNPLSLEVLTTALKKATVIHVSEMLPSPDDLWFSDTRGHVCCEIRTTFSTIKKELYEYAE